MKSQILRFSETCFVDFFFTSSFFSILEGVPVFGVKSVSI